MMNGRAGAILVDVHGDVFGDKLPDRPLTAIIGGYGTPNPMKLVILVSSPFTGCSV